MMHENVSIKTIRAMLFEIIMSFIKGTIKLILYVIFCLIYLLECSIINNEDYKIINHFLSITTLT